VRGHSARRVVTTVSLNSGFGVKVLRRYELKHEYLSHSNS
jgi:hypothetical protein